MVQLYPFDTVATATSHLCGGNREIAGPVHRALPGSLSATRRAGKDTECMGEGYPGRSEERTSCLRTRGQAGGTARWSPDDKKILLAEELPHESTLACGMRRLGRKDGRTPRNTTKSVLMAKDVQQGWQGILRHTDIDVPESPAGSTWIVDEVSRIPDDEHS